MKASHKDYDFCYVHAGLKNPETINLLSVDRKVEIFTCIRHPISSFISSIRHARRDNDYSIIPHEYRMICGCYSDLNFNKINERVNIDERSNRRIKRLNTHQFTFPKSTYIIESAIKKNPNIIKLERYTYFLSLGDTKAFSIYSQNARDLLTGSTSDLITPLHKFKYVGLYELFPDLLQKLCQSGFVCQNAINENNERINAGKQIEDDEISLKTASLWYNQFPSDFILWNYIYKNLMSEKYGWKHPSK